MKSWNKVSGVLGIVGASIHFMMLLVFGISIATAGTIVYDNPELNTAVMVMYITFLVVDGLLSIGTIITCSLLLKPGAKKSISILVFIFSFTCAIFGVLPLLYLVIPSFILLLLSTAFSIVYLVKRTPYIPASDPYSIYGNSQDTTN
jgi:hypothetical protein